MTSLRKPLLVLKEELVTVLTITLEEAIRKVDERFDEALSALAAVEGEEPMDDEEMDSSAGFINDEPEDVSSSSSSSSRSDDEELEEEEEEEEEQPPSPPPPSKKKKEKKKRAAAPPSVHYKMKPQVGKRARVPPRRFSPSRITKERPVESESISESSGGGAPTRTERDQWNVVRRLTREQRNRNPWWSRTFAGPLDQVRQGLGYESDNNRGPTELWDAMGLHPEYVEFEELPLARRAKCAFCGHSKMCTKGIRLSDGGGYHLVGSLCVDVAKAWHHMAELLADASRVELEDVQRALKSLQSAHAAKAERNKTWRYK